MTTLSVTSRLKPTFQVPATRGRMGTTDYYTATLPFGAVTKLFVFDPEEMLELTPENRTQRILNTKRIPEIANYVLDHDDYIFSAITVSVDSDDVEFVPVQEGADIGSLVLPLEAKYVINDGQHRVAGISEALRRDSSLARDTISVVVLPDGGLERSQQIFSDLNRTVHKTSKSLDILFDHRLPINRITMACLHEVPLFRDRIDKERVSLSVRSPKFATLSGLQQANVQLLGNLSENLPEADVRSMTSLAAGYWTRLTDLVAPWRDILDGDTKPQHARQVYVSSYALSLWALGSAGAAARAARDSAPDWTSVLDGLSSIDWRKTNPNWQGICMADNEVVTRAPTRRATANYIMWRLGLNSERPASVIAEDRMQRAVIRDTPRGLSALAQRLEPDPRIVTDKDNAKSDMIPLSTNTTDNEIKQDVARSAQSSKAVGQPDSSDPTGRQPQAIELFGKLYPIKSHAKGLATLAEVLNELDPEKFATLLDLRGSKRPFVSRDPSDLIRSRPVGKSGYFVEVNLDAPAIWNRARLFLRHLGHLDSVLKLKLEDD